MAATRYTKGQYLAVTYLTTHVRSDGKRCPIASIEYGTVLSVDEETHLITLVDELDLDGQITRDSHFFSFHADHSTIVQIQILPT